ncbi:alpha-galactosidase [Wukongibacter baidiensis]|uniref:alpha-galactosidase n=1 Tax=Wukongibacter baidiensis TaxID=1723361 RepID=UPI003D7F501D
MISYCKDRKTFNLMTRNSSYVFRVSSSGHLEHIHWGGKVTQEDYSLVNPFLKRAWSANPLNDGSYFTLDTFRSEYPTYGYSDFREPAIEVLFQSENRVLNLIYKNHVVIKGKKQLEDLPCSQGDEEVETLIVNLKDDIFDLRVRLLYSIYYEADIIVRSSLIINDTSETVNLERAYSASIDFDDNDFKLLHLSGSWARERHIMEKDLNQGFYAIESKRGNSSHQHNPFVAFKRQETTEKNGEAYGMSLIYSGNFKNSIEVNEYDQMRVGLGINSFGFRWTLKPGMSFQTPEAVLTYSDKGLNGMSHNFHSFIKKYILRGIHKSAERPVLINNWEATYFDFDEEKLLALAEVAKSVGIELFVLDDGWFGKRDAADCSLGDWYVNTHKIPSGLDGLAKKLNEKGLKFGLWVEPEMVSPDSDLYRKHPDWCIHEVGRSRSQCRNQLVLDFSREDVQDYIIQRLTKVFNSANIEYVKWDMNRNITEAGSALNKISGEIFHRYILGLYRVLNQLMKNCPKILFESCAGGGGRFDLGMLYYMPQVWTSDNTDAFERIKIQYGTSLAYPPVAMGSHVSDVPNHQVMRMTNLDARYHTAMFGNLGYELDLTKLNSEELIEIEKQIKKYKEVRSILQYGTFDRLISPFEKNYAAWQVMSEDGNDIIAYYARGLSRPNDKIRRLRLVNLNPNDNYRILNQVYRGNYLMAIGLTILPKKGDFLTEVYHLKRMDVK